MKEEAPDVMIIDDKPYRRMAPGMITQEGDYSWTAGDKEPIKLIGFGVTITREHIPHYRLSVTKNQEQIYVPKLGEIENSSKLPDVWHSGVGWPHQVYLQNWAFGIHQVFGEQVYQVGSSITKRNPTDIDVVVMLSDIDFEKWFGKEGDCLGSWKWEWICAAFSELGRKMTGLNIDFKVQRTSETNEKHKGPRSAIGLLQKPEHGCIVRTDLEKP